MEHCKKLNNWNFYGIRRFPYRGRRKYSPGIYKTFGGSIFIQNDVFGMTIFQFERELRACLTRRKEREQFILNIRFPDKTTKEYIEYLEYGDATVEGCISIVEQTMSDVHRIYRDLIQIAGTELEIRTRQRMFVVIDKIQNRASGNIRGISSGSLAEGIDIPGSDVDVMWELKNVSIIEDLKYLYTSMGQTTLLMEHDVRYPGFCKLKLVAEADRTSRLIRHFLTETYSGVYMSTESFILFFAAIFPSASTHGPCLSDPDQNNDHAFCLRSKCWPTNAINWIDRHRAGQWPTEHLIDTVVNDGCLFVPIGPKNEEDSELLWRISFSLAEKRLSHSLNYTQLLCYVLLKCTLKIIINRNKDVKDLLCSYFLKTTVFWLSEEICIDTFKITNSSHCFSLCIDKLISFVRNCYCPNYFIPQHNMFIGKVDESNNKLLFSILCDLKNTELKIIIDQIFGNNFFHHSVCTTADKNKISVNLDLLFYRAVDAVPVGDIVDGYKTLQYIKLLMESESSEFILGVLRYFHAQINQNIPQTLILPEHRRERYNIIRRCNKHLMDGTETDAVSGWLLYASFYYVLGQYKNTLRIVDKVMSCCTPGMIMLNNTFHTTEDRNKYQHETEIHLTLNQKMRQSTFHTVFYIKQSTLIPQELQLEVQEHSLQVPPVVMCNCLQFLCYHHLGHVNNRQCALRELNFTIKEKYLMAENHLSQSLVILGVCHELAGDKDTAYHCYNEALHCAFCVCPSGEQRIKNLLHT